MGLQQNMADAIRMIMTINHMTLAELSEELEIARSTLQEYLKAEGNPTITMIEHLAEKLGIDPAVLLTGLLGIDRREMVLLLFSSVQEVIALPEEKRIRFAELFLEMVLLWNQDGKAQEEGR